MTTNAVTGRDGWGVFCGWAEAAAVATTAKMQAVPAIKPSLLVRPPIVGLTGDAIARRSLVITLSD
jgi:hypothetical protein